jgi:spore coat polysaccharide biosynthesis protein SpsF
MVMLRPAQKSDSKLLYDWANETDVRNMSIDSNAIEWKDHIHWFERKITDPHTRIFIMIENGKEIGQIRMENKNSEWLIGYSIAEEYRGKGYGKKIIELGLKEIRTGIFVALVKINNTASVKIFSGLNFAQAGLVEEDGVQLIKFIFEKAS